MSKTSNGKAKRQLRVQRVVSRTFRTHKIDDGLYSASALAGELAYGTTRRAAVKILKHDLCA